MRKQLHAVPRAPGKSRIATMCWSICATRSKAPWADQPGSLPEVAAVRGEPQAPSQPGIAALQASPALTETAAQNERAGVPHDQREASGAHLLTIAEQRRQISRAHRLARN